MAKAKPTKPWKHLGGGCMLWGGGAYPCDDDYQHARTKKRVTFSTTTQAHFKMPDEAASIEEILALDGVTKARKE